MFIRCWSFSPLPSQGLLGSQRKWLSLVKSNIFQMFKYTFTVITAEVKSCCLNKWKHAEIYIEEPTNVPSNFFMLYSLALANNKHHTNLRSLQEQVKSYVNLYCRKMQLNLDKHQLLEFSVMLIETVLIKHTVNS